MSDIYKRLRNQVLSTTGCKVNDQAISMILAWQATTPQSEIEALRARVAELEEAASWCEAENGDMQSLMALVRVVDQGCSKAWLRRKQAEAVEAALLHIVTAPHPTTAQQAVEQCAQRLRNQAGKIEQENNYE